MTPQFYDLLQKRLHTVILSGFTIRKIYRGKKGKTACKTGRTEISRPTPGYLFKGSSIPASSNPFALKIQLSHFPQGTSSALSAPNCPPLVRDCDGRCTGCGSEQPQ